MPEKISTATKIHFSQSSSDAFANALHEKIEPGLEMKSIEAKQSKVPPQYGVKTLDGEFTYKGQLKDEMMHGYGMMTFANGRMYEGQFEKNLPHGYGMMKCPNGDMYKGQFKYGMMHGYGIMTFPNGKVYEGQFRKNSPHGYGIMTCANGNSYKGEFHQKTPQGYGIMKHVNGTVYIGQIHHGKLHGAGKVISTIGIETRGHFFHDVMINSSISDLGDGNFLFSLFSLFGGITRTAMTIGIAADFLEKNEKYKEYAPELRSALQRLQIASAQFPSESLKLHKELIEQKKSHLFRYGFFEHCMMVRLRPEQDRDVVICELFNSGKGLRCYHVSQGGKYQTMLQIEIPFDQFTPEIIKNILRNRCKNEHEAYRLFLDAPQAKVVEHQKNPVRQTPQKEDNCEAECVFAYLKNIMPDNLYKELRYDLFHQCLQETQKNEDPTTQKLLRDLADIIQAKLQKKAKRIHIR